MWNHIFSGSGEMSWKITVQNAREYLEKLKSWWRILIIFKKCTHLCQHKQEHYTMLVSNPLKSRYGNALSLALIHALFYNEVWLRLCTENSLTDSHIWVLEIPYQFLNFYTCFVKPLLWTGKQGHEGLRRRVEMNTDWKSLAKFIASSFCRCKTSCFLIMSDSLIISDPVLEFLTILPFRVLPSS